jgi:hypothetical protein
MRLGLAFKAFFSVLGNQETAERIRAAMVAAPDAIKVPAALPSKPLAEQQPSVGRSEALTLLSTLQREARLLDLVQEPLDGYSDAQIGAAARDVLRDTSKTLHRLMGIRKLVEAAEGDRIELPGERSPSRWRMLGSASHASKGTLVHAGWQASHCQIPQWTGASDDALILAPAEVEA